MRRSLVCLATIGAADLVLHRKKLPWITLGLFDHPAHLATAGLVGANAKRSRAWKAGLLVGSLLPDLDHVPLALSPPHPEEGDGRPVTHCLAAIAPVAAAAAITQSERLHGAAAGMASHYARDLGVGSGVPLLWPLTDRSFRVPYPVYAAACVALAVLALSPAYSRSRP